MNKVMKHSMLKCIVLSCASLAAYNATAADVNAGKAKSAMCAGCHGATGVSAVAIYPNLAGQKAPYIEKQLTNFRSGSRVDPVMSAMAKPLSDTDIANLAAYFSSL